MTKKKVKTNQNVDKNEEEAAERGGGNVAVAERSAAIEPLDWFGDWVERWPSMFGRRIPDLRDLRVGLAEPFAGLETMRVEEYVDEEEDEAVIRVEIPGVDPEKDIDISVVGDRLTVSAEREERTTTTGNGRRSEFRYGSFRRSMTVPPGVDAEDVTATYTDGILEIRVPIDDEAEAKTKVPIKRAAAR